MAPMAAIAEANISQGRRRWIRGASEASEDKEKTGPVWESFRLYLTYADNSCFPPAGSRSAVQK